VRQKKPAIYGALANSECSHSQGTSRESNENVKSKNAQYLHSKISGLLVALLALLIGVAPATAGEIFSAGGSTGIKKGYIGMPAAVWNPPSNGVHPSALPYTVPAGKTLLLSDIFIETDPLDPYPFLMVLGVDDGSGFTSLRTVHFRESADQYRSFATPIPIAAGHTLHLLLYNLMPAPQAVNWALTGTVADAATVVTTAGNPGAVPPHTQHPLPNIVVVTPTTKLPAGPQTSGTTLDSLFTSDFVANASNELARVESTAGALKVLDRDLGISSGDLFQPVWVADFGTAGGTILDQEMPPCSTFTHVVLLGTSYVGRFPVATCQPNTVTVNFTGSFSPGQMLQYD
jgi:hypothetical protein